MTKKGEKDKEGGGGGNAKGGNAKNGLNKNLISIVIVLAIVAAYGIWYLSQHNITTYSVSGIKVVSEIPLERIQRWRNIALYNSSDKTAITCNFELSAISLADITGPKIHVERGDTGIYVRHNEAYIKGGTDDELLMACHVFACLRDNITCPENLDKIRSIVNESLDLNIILDKKVGGAGGRGYAELLGVLGYIQAKKTDANQDGVITQEEINQNEVFIFPYLKENNTCRLLPLNNLIERLDPQNVTRDCDIEPGIHITSSDKNEVQINGSKIILLGDDDRLHTEAIILRSIISPEWIRVVYNLE